VSTQRMLACATTELAQPPIMAKVVAVSAAGP
jgi:hypothetical protein